MLFLPATRRPMLSAGGVLSIIIFLSCRHSFRTGSPLTSKLTSTTNTICPVLPDLQALPPGKALYDEIYDDCSGITEFLFVGEANALGSPKRCLNGGSRLRQHNIIPGHNWSEVQWGRVQRQCIAHEYKLWTSEDEPLRIWRQPADSQMIQAPSKDEEKRAAIVLRTWDNYEYTEKRLVWLRTLITEVSLQRTRKYQVFFLVNVKDPSIRLEEDDVAYEQAMRRFVPEEFRDTALLFNERTLKAWYPLVQEHGAQDQMYQALQIFSRKLQQYDYIWQLEMDLRFTGHVHDTLQSATAFARGQRRRNLWERNGRFYIPHLYNNSYQDFSAAVDADFGYTGIWGPVHTPNFEAKGPQPPPRVNDDWGVGEEADLISFMPMIDPVGTNWIYEDGIHGFAAGTETPRRAAIVSITRSSRRLLQLIDEAQQVRGQWLVSEATLETFALLHGLKAVTVPHLITFGKGTKTEALGDINRGPPHSKAGGESPSMLYTKDGWLPGPWWEASYWFTGDRPGDIWKEYVEGKLLPPMLLHPVKEK